MVGGIKKALPVPAVKTPAGPAGAAGKAGAAAGEAAATAAKAGAAGPSIASDAVDIAEMRLRSQLDLAPPGMQPKLTPEAAAKQVATVTEKLTDLRDSLQQAVGNKLKAMASGDAEGVAAANREIKGINREIQAATRLLEKAQKALPAGEKDGGSQPEAVF
ncbi:MAG: hypothetical protein VKS61_07585 [Candidatus Sericytochromatia bacterium]|nr:hypothetical protein [Candidatus Sericytochromatia bacterium]